MNKAQYNKIMCKVASAQESGSYLSMVAKLEGKDFIEQQKIVWQWVKDNRKDMSFTMFVVIMEKIYKGQYYLD